MPRIRPVAPGSILHIGGTEIPENVKVLMRPQEGPQWDLQLLEEKEILFGGARGGGKSEGARIWNCRGNPYEDQRIPVNVSYTYHPGFRSLILRKTYKDQLDFVDKARSSYKEAYGAVWRDEGFFEFPSGAKTVVGHLGTEDAYMQYQGQEFQRITIEEVTQIPSLMLYLRTISSCRSKFAEIKPQVLLTANPEGPGFGWVKKRFMTDPKTGKKIPPRTRIEEKIYNPISGQTEIQTRIFLPSKVSDNKILLKSDPGYLIWLLSLPDSLRKAYYDGDWDVLGGKYFHNFRSTGPLEGEPEWANHITESAQVWLMPWYRRWCGLDIGFEHWTSCHWFCENEEDERIYVYDTLRARRMGLYDFGAQWARKTLNYFGEDSITDAITVWMSHDAFHRRDSSPEAQDISPVARFKAGAESIIGRHAVYIPTQEDMPDTPEFFERLEKQREIKVIVRKAPMDNKNAQEFVRDLLEWKKPQMNAETYDHEYAKRLLDMPHGGELYVKYMKLHIKASEDPKLPKVKIFLDKCKTLIDQIDEANYDEDRLKIAKVDTNPETGEGGDDDLQAFIYGLSGYRKSKYKPSRMPDKVKIQRQVFDVQKANGFKLDEGQLMHVRFAAWAKTKAEKPKTSIKLRRRSSHWARNDGTIGKGEL